MAARGHDTHAGHPDHRGLRRLPGPARPGASRAAGAYRRGGARGSLSSQAAAVEPPTVTERSLPEAHAVGRPPDRTAAGFRPPWWCRGGHAQTIASVVLRRARLALDRERVETGDGDFVDL